jgi:putative nucleotidyltransferase with HDIG domain
VRRYGQSVDDLVSASQKLAERLVGPLGRRWLHVQAVAARAEELLPAVRAGSSDTHVDEETLVAAAWLHDIGYSPEIARTGFHPLDGADYLRGHGFPMRVVALVAHHSGARFEAAERTLSVELSRYGLEDSPVMDALVTADLTTGPGGERLTYNERMDEILSRYASDHPVHRTWLKARSILAPAVERTEARLAAAQPK